MKNTTEKIFDLLSDDLITKSFKSIADSNPKKEHGEVYLQDSYERFMTLRELLITAANNGSLDEVSQNRRATIYNNLNAMNQHRGNWQQLISQTENLYDNVTIAGLFMAKMTSKDFATELKELTKLKRSITDFKKNYDGTKRNLEFISKKKVELDELINLIKDEINEIESIKETSQIHLNETLSNIKSSDENLETIKESRKEVEEQKLAINTFSENIEEYKAQIEKLEEKAKDVVSKDEKIKSLISEAETALQLKSAQGISGAFSSQHEKASDSKNYWPWIIASIAFLITAISLTVWAITGYGVTNPDSFGSIAGRIVAVGIAVSGAAFCAKQYVKQKNIAEDYAYKAVLSKSIIAFANEIKKSDISNNGEQVGKYLQKVLEEIHRDPLRTRKEESKNEISKNTIDHLTKMAEIFNKVK